MLNNRKTHWAFISAVLILLVLVIPIHVYQGNLANSVLYDNKVANVSRPSGSISHPTIAILSDDDFVTQLWPGSGQETSPYRIENLNITGPAGTPCIDIRNTRAYFIIKNCTLTGPADNRAIQIINATNGRIVNNNITNSWDGITALTSGDLNITGNWFNNTFNGIGLYGPRMIVQSNTMKGTGQSRISIGSADNSTIFNNTLYEMANGFGVLVDDSKNVMVTNNTCTGIPSGFYISGTSDNTILANNSVYDSRFGGIMIHSDRVSVMQNNFTLVDNEGLFLDTSWCTIADNIFSRGSDGIWLFGASHATIENNTIYQNGRGIAINGSAHDNSIIGNIVYSNTKSAIDNGTSNFIGTNYWSDYVGTDSNSDGIGDTPYPIPGSAGNEDAHPLMTPSTPRFATYWIDVPTYQHAEKGYGFHYLMNCTTPAPVEWWLTGVYSEDFSIDSSGLITNSTTWDDYPNSWHLTVWGRNIYSYLLSASFVVNLTDTLAPTWDQIPVDQIHEYKPWAVSFTYDLNASDRIGVQRYWMNDTVHFSINSNNGILTGAVTLEIGEVYGLEVRAYDEANNSCSATFRVTVVDTIPPEIQGPEDQIYDNNTQGTLGLSWTVYDYSLQNYTLLLNGAVIKSGVFTYTSDSVGYSATLDGLQVGVYNYTLVVEDRAGHVVSDTVLVTIVPFEGPTSTTAVPPPIPVELIVVVAIVGVVILIVVLYAMRRKA